MILKNSRLWVQHRPWVVARDSFLILLVASVARYALRELIEPYAVFHFFIIACLIVAVRYGYRAAFVCLVVSVFVGNFFFVKPYNTFAQITTSDLIPALNFFFVTGVAVVVIEKLQRTIYAQKLLIKIMSDRQRSMLFRQNDLVQKLRSSAGAAHE
jgi:K+-sensing histidine kinase KdpD